MPKPEDLKLEDLLLTASDAARVLECSSDNVRRLARAGVLRPAMTTDPARPVNLYRRADVEALRAKRARPRKTPIPTERRSRKAVRR